MKTNRTVWVQTRLPRDRFDLFGNTIRVCRKSAGSVAVFKLCRKPTRYENNVSRTTYACIWDNGGVYGKRQRGYTGLRLSESKIDYGNRWYRPAGMSEYITRTRFLWPSRVVETVLRCTKQRAWPITGSVTDLTVVKNRVREHKRPLDFSPVESQ